MYFDEKLRDLRLKAGFSLEEVAEKLDIEKIDLEYLETGFKDPTDREMQKIMSFYNVTKEDLADDEPIVSAFDFLFPQDEDMGEKFKNPLELAGSFLAAKKPKAQEQENKEVILESGQLQVINHIKKDNDNLVFEYDSKIIHINDLPQGEYLAIKARVVQALEFGLNDIIILKKENDFIEDKPMLVMDEIGNLFVTHNIYLKNILVVGQVKEIRKYY